MAYRGDAEPAASCSKHAAAAAVASCGSCGVALCEICLSYVGTDARCPACARSSRRSRGVLRGLFVGLAILIAIGAVGVAGYVATRPKRFDYGTRKGEIMALDEAFDRAPCEKKPTLQFMRTLSSLGDYRGVLEHTDEFFDKCGDWPRLRWLSENAHDHLKEYDAAIADATKLIEGAPNDQDYWWWRGQAKEHKGDLDGAIADMRHSLELLPKATNIAANLARVLEQKGLRCDARDTLLAFIDHRPAAAGYPWVQSELARLGEGCPKLEVQTFPVGDIQGDDKDPDKREGE